MHFFRSSNRLQSLHVRNDIFIFFSNLSGIVGPCFNAVVLNPVDRDVRRGLRKIFFSYKSPLFFFRFFETVLKSVLTNWVDVLRNC